jgi:DNA-directed RNA polymerase alpha subunit
VSRVGKNGNQWGSIDDLLLPPRAWHVLRREKVNTLAKLRAVADRLEQFEGIGPKTAKVIRAELARIKATDKGKGS